jgi:hypothetical protein
MMDDETRYDLRLSLIRTLVPIGVGAVMASAVGPYVDESAVRDLLAGLIAAAYYTTARVLELAVPHAGWLLGSPRPPFYS